MKTKNKNININKISFIIALFFTFTGLPQGNVALGASISAGEMINLTNDSRAEAGLHRLLINEELTEAAKEKANNMFEFQYFDHNSPSGSTPWDFIRLAGYDYRYAGENLAIDFVTAASAHRALMESSSHRENILNSNYTEIGIVAIEGMFNGNKSIIIVEEFGAPLLERASGEYDLNENVEFILEEKVNGINTSKNYSKEEDNLSEEKKVAINLSDKKQDEVELLPEIEKISEQDNLLLGSSTSNSGNGNISFGPFGNNQDEILYHSYEDLKDKFQQFEIQSSGRSLNEEKNSEIITECNSMLLAKNLNNKNVMGLVEKAHAEDKQIKKYNYYQESVRSIGSNYFQNGFILRVFLFYVALVSLLMFNLMAVIYFYMEKEDRDFLDFCPHLKPVDS